jgi:hypothetical protein
MADTPIPISNRPAFRLVVLRVIAHFVRQSLEETISLTEMTAVINTHALVSLARAHLSSSQSVSIRDVIIALMAMFQGSEIRILENKDQFKLRLTREQFDEMVQRVQKEYDTQTLEALQQDERDYFAAITPTATTTTTTTTNTTTANKKLLIVASQLLDSLASFKSSSLFARPPDDATAPDYHTLIRHPTDLTSIRAQLKSGTIQTPLQLQRELLLMYANATMYNKSGSDVSRWAQEMLAETDKLWDLLIAENS